MTLTAVLGEGFVLFYDSGRVYVWSSSSYISILLLVLHLFTLSQRYVCDMYLLSYTYTVKSINCEFFIVHITT